jgi:hypothetical protein
MIPMIPMIPVTNVSTIPTASLPPLLKINTVKKMLVTVTASDNVKECPRFALMTIVLSVDVTVSLIATLAGRPLMASMLPIRMHVRIIFVTAVVMMVVNQHVRK